MPTDIVLFLRAPVPRAMLLPALEHVFSLTLDSADVPNADADGTVAFAEYAEGFAVGAGISAYLPLPAQRAAQSLAAILKTDVLLENTEALQPRDCWLLLSPGSDAPRPVRIVELRHGLAVAPMQDTMVEETEAFA